MRGGIVRRVFLLALLLAAGSAGAVRAEKAAWKEPAAALEKGLETYSLPLSKEEVSKEFAPHLAGLGAANDEVVKALAERGYCVLKGPCGQCLYNLMYWFQYRGYPLYLTADAVFYLYHLQFDAMLKELEEKRLASDLLGILNLLDSELAGTEAKTPFMQEARRRARVYLGVARSLLGEKIRFADEETGRLVGAELALIEKAGGFSVSPLFHYKEDYSQYKPRGHYTRSETLRRYFKAMMWLGRPAFLLNGGKGRLVDEREARIQTAAALMLAEAAEAQGGKALAALEKFDSLLSLLIGPVENLWLRDYAEAMRKLSLDAASVEDEASYERLKEYLRSLPPPSIFSGLGKPVTGNEAPSPGALEEVNENTRGMRLMGQRFTIDAYAFSRLVYPSVTRFEGKGEPLTGKPSRYLPSPFDLPALMGFGRAAAHAERMGHTAYKGYAKRFGELAEALGKHMRKAPETVYDGWLKALDALDDRTAFDLQPFQRAEGWKDRLLNTFLGSWATLKHDSILYSQQPYCTEEGVDFPPKAVKPKVPGYVEPEPAFFARLVALAEMTAGGMEALGYGKEAARFRKLERFTRTCLKLVETEIAGKPFSAEQKRFLAGLPDSCYLFENVDPRRDRPEPAPVIADVATDSNGGRVLEVGIGPFFSLGVVTALPGGEKELCFGAVFSFAAFTSPMAKRLTDERWRMENEFALSARLWTWLLSPLPCKHAGEILEED